MAKERKMKTHFTRKNLISLGLIFFYLVMCLVAALCLDLDGIMKKGNPLQDLSHTFGFPDFVGSWQAYVLILVTLIYILLYAAAFIYEMRLAKFYENKIWTKKWVLVYIVTFLICSVLCFGIGLTAQYPYSVEAITNSFLFLVASLFVGFIIYIALTSFIGAAIMLYINFKNIDKPFKFFSARAEEAMEEERAVKEEAKQEEQGELAASFGDTPSSEGAIAGGYAAGVGGAIPTGAGSTAKEELSDREKVFPGLCTIDYLMENKEAKAFDDANVNLKDLCDDFRKYLAKEEGLFFDIETIRAFVSGLSASRLIILEGLSGTGKSSLARYFSEYIGEKSFFEPVQATWRDRTSILGYFNDFNRTYNETEFLKRLYQATFEPNNINIMVLDELNISRVEYYFADFLSILEYPVDEWKLRIMQLPYDFEAPMHLEYGILNIAPTTWFIGTANKDDSTYTITDKVYDRAITLSFDDRNEPFEVEEETPRISLSYNRLMSLFKSAQEDKDLRLRKDEFTKFKTLTDFTYNTFDLTFGNRIMHQIELLVPVYVACGGKKEEALDFMFARKVVSKLEGRFEDYVKQGLMDLLKLIKQTYGVGTFALTEHVINKLLRKL